MQDGPADVTHHAIHEAAHEQAAALIERATRLNDEEPDAFRDAVSEFIELVDARILVHAAVEEFQIYQPWIEDPRNRPAVIAALLGEHQTLRQLVSSLKRATEGSNFEMMLSYMQRILDASKAHAEHEEAVLRSLYNGTGPN